MKVLITGGAGFIGSHVVERYLSAGWDVAVVDDLSTGRGDNVPEGATFYELDIRDLEFAEVVAAERPDVLSHHAAQMDVRISTAEPAFDADVNIIGSIKVIEAALGAGVRKFIFASSGGAVYGEPEKLPVDEDAPARPVSQYGCSKLAVERYLYLYGVQRGLDYVALRYPNVYGPRQDPRGEAGVTAIFALKMLEGEPCTIYGDGTESRDYVYIDDVVDAHALAAESGYNGVLCIGSSEEITVPEIFAELSALTGNKVEPRREPLRPGEIHRICISGEKAKAELGWEPKVLFADGLARLVEHVQENRGRYA
ncbi:MAG: NAD-dependent epimerase/dehydratase family protein [candidate division Zixibacteria bacterium]|nr:NAD-dependent epimerase/dehydratase family protein [candidate division Zixibacteria bacterium]